MKLSLLYLKRRKNLKVMMNKVILITYAAALLQKSYWESITIRDEKVVHKHLRLCGVNEKNMKKARIMDKRVCDLTPEDINILREG